MPVSEDKNIRVPICHSGEHTDHKVGVVVFDKDQGIKGLYCLDCKKFGVFMFAKNKDWTAEKAVEYIKNREVEEDMTASVNSNPFVLTEDIEAFTIGESNIPKGEPNDDGDFHIAKIDPLKQIVYGVFLVPEKADHHGDVISTVDVEKVAHGFIADYRDIDEMHKANTINADIVESAIAWEDGVSFHGAKLTKGTWFGAIKINDRAVWDKVLEGTYKAFSVRIAGIREPIDGEDKEDA